MLLGKKVVMQVYSPTDEVTVLRFILAIESVLDAIQI
jgi:hypothetical protein